MNKKKGLPTSTKVDMVIGKVGNLVYYFSIDTRSSAQYLHVVKDLRNDLRDLLELKEDFHLRELLQILYSVIPKRVSSSILERVINDLRKELVGYGN